jgi:hypothetical protein
MEISGPRLGPGLSTLGLRGEEHLVALGFCHRRLPSLFAISRTGGLRATPTRVERIFKFVLQRITTRLEEQEIKNDLKKKIGNFFGNFFGYFFRVRLKHLSVKLVFAS